MPSSVAGLTTEHRIPGWLESFNKPANSPLKVKFLCFNHTGAGYRHWSTLLWTNSPPSLHRNLHNCKVREVVSCLLYKVKFSGYELAAINRTNILQRSPEPSWSPPVAAVKIRRAFIGKLRHSAAVTCLPTCRCGQDLWLLRRSVTRKGWERLIISFYITVFIQHINYYPFSTLFCGKQFIHSVVCLTTGT
jgi:hypothetical protein